MCEGSPEFLFTDNETNFERLFGVANPVPYVKDGINDHVVGGRDNRVNPERIGTKASARYHLHVGAGQQATVKLRLTTNPDSGAFGDAFDELFLKRRREADEFYEAIAPEALTPDERMVQRQAFASLVMEQAILQLQRTALAARGSVRARTAAGTSAWAQPRLEASK